MRGKKWYQVNLYPNTKRGDFSMVVFENHGFSWTCDAHKKRRCKGCSHFLNRRMVTSYRVDAGEVTELLEAIEIALDLVRHDVATGGRPPRSFSRPWDAQA